MLHLKLLQGLKAQGFSATLKDKPSEFLNYRPAELG